MEYGPTAWSKENRVVGVIDCSRRFQNCKSWVEISNLRNICLTLWLLRQC